MLVGTGEYSYPSNITSLARSTFIKLLIREVPEVENDLHEAQDIYIEAVRDHGKFTGYSQVAETAVCAPLNEALNTWATRHNLNADWCKDTALRAFEYWTTSPEDYDSDYWEGGDWRDVPMKFGDASDISHRLFEFSHSVDGLLWSTREQIIAELRSEFESAVTAYLNHLDSIMQESGYAVSPKKRSPDHFLWFIRYQVQRRSQNDIAQVFNQERTTVRDALRTISDLIKLPIRERSRPGRPRHPQTN
jgi:hypothetical protein